MTKKGARGDFGGRFQPVIERRRKRKKRMRRKRGRSKSDGRRRRRKGKRVEGKQPPRDGRPGQTGRYIDRKRGKGRRKYNN